MSISNNSKIDIPFISLLNDGITLTNIIKNYCNDGNTTYSSPIIGYSSNTIYLKQSFNWNNDLFDTTQVGDFNIELNSTESFNGNGFTIDLTNITTSGLFTTNSTSNNITIQNTQIINGSLNANSGFFIRQNQSYFTISNCCIKSNINNQDCGGLVGSDCSNFNVEQSYFSGNIDSSNCGGIVGSYVNNATIDSCFFVGNINVSNSSGIVGTYCGSSHIKNCYSSCKLNIANTTGILGLNNTGLCIIQNCYNTSYNTYTKGTGCFNIGPSNENVITQNCYSSDNNNIDDINAGGLDSLNISSTYTTYTNTGDAFIQDSFDYNQYPLLKCFREIYWNKSEYENFNQTPNMSGDLIGLLEGGHTEIELKNFGFDVEDFKTLNYSIVELREIGFTLQQILNGGYTTADLMLEGFTMPMILEETLSLDQLKLTSTNDYFIEKTTETIDGVSKTIYTLTCDISWTDIEDITSNTDFFTLQPNEIFNGNNHIIFLNNVNTRGLFSCGGSNISNAPIIKNLRLYGGSIMYDDYYDNGNAFLVRKENKFFIIDSCIIESTLTGGFSGAFAGMYSGFEKGHCKIMNSVFTGDISGNNCGGIIGSSCGNGGKCEIIDCIVNGNIYGQNSGGVVGFASGNAGGLCTINNCSFNGNVVGKSSGGITGSHAGNRGKCVITDCECSGNILGDWCGGIVGSNAGYKGICEISGCNSKSTINGTYSGGIAGMNAGNLGSCTIDTCDVSSNILIDISGNGAGGISGAKTASSGNCQITSCITYGLIKAENAGGIVGMEAGLLDGSCIIQQCYVNSSIEISANNSGFIIGSYGGHKGYCQATVCYVEGSSSINANNCGGIAGYRAGYNGRTFIQECYYNGNITGNNCGSIIGADSGSNSGQIIVRNSYSLGNISGLNCGGIGGYSCGSNNGYCVVQSCYSACEFSAVDSSSNGGFFGSNAGSNSGFLIIQNGYYSGSISNGNGGLCGINYGNNDGKVISQGTYSNTSNNGLNGDYHISLLLTDDYFDASLNAAYIYDAILSNDVNDGNNFIADLSGDINLPLLKEFRKVPWNRSNYVNYNDSPGFGITLSDLKLNGYSDEELFEYGYTALQLQEANFNILELLQKGYYNDGELDATQFLTEVSNNSISISEIRNYLRNYGKKISLQPISDRDVLQWFYNNFVYSYQGNDFDLNKQLILCSHIYNTSDISINVLNINDDIKTFIENGNYIYFENKIDNYIGINIGYNQNIVKVIDVAMEPVLLLNNSQYKLSELIRFNSVTMAIYGVGQDDTEQSGAILFRGQLNGSTSGDPHIYPLDGGEKYELPNIVSNYRLVQNKISQNIYDYYDNVERKCDFIVNASTREINNIEKQNIIDYYKYKMNTEPPENLLVNGVFYDNVYIQSEGNIFSINFETMKVEINMKHKDYFKIKKVIKDGRKQIFEENCDYIQSLILRIKHSKYGLIDLHFDYYSNPQIKYGITMRCENIRYFNGLLVSEVDCKRMSINNLENIIYKRPVALKNKIYSYHSK